MNQEDQEAYSHFKETLDTELRQNVKTVIMSLTMLAEDYKQSGAVIVKAIEEYIKEVSWLKKKFPNFQDLESSIE